MIRLFDAYCGFGGKKPGDRREYSREAWLGEMDRLSIDRALVRTAPEDMDRNVPASRQSLLEACEDLSKLVPCPVVMPNAPFDGMSDAERVGDLIAHGAGAVCIRPKNDYWSLKEWASGDLFRAIQDHRLPVFCRDEEVSLEQVAELAGRYPDLPFVAAGNGFRVMRTVFPLLKIFNNVFVSLGGPFTAHRGLEALVSHVGAERILFGTGYPETEPMAAITILTYSSLADEQKALIGSGNLERLLSQKR